MIKVSSLLIGVSDLTKARVFFENVFEMTFEEFRPPFASATLGAIEFNIEENTSDREAGWVEMHIGSRKQFSFEVDDLEGFIERAKASGAEIVFGPKEQSWGWKEVVISDTDHNEFLIEQKI